MGRIQLKINGRFRNLDVDPTTPVLFRRRDFLKDGGPAADPYLDLVLELPTIEISLLNRTDVPATGAGETIITVVPAAIGNAIFNVTGARLREVPFTADRVKAALSAA